MNDIEKTPNDYALGVKVANNTELVCESSTTLCASSFQNFSSVSSSHSLSETVFLFSLTLLRLVSS